MPHIGDDFISPAIAEQRGSSQARRRHGLFDRLFFAGTIGLWTLITLGVGFSCAGFKSAPAIAGTTSFAIIFLINISDFIVPNLAKVGSKRFSSN